MVERWAQRLLVWWWDGGLLRAEVSVARYFVLADLHEVIAHASRTPTSRSLSTVDKFRSPRGTRCS
jgi:hypothetical protein